MLGKKTFLAMALALVVFAAPASATAAEWIHTEEGPVTEGSEGFSGFVEFYAPSVASGIGCVVHTQLEITGASSAEVTGFEITTTTCEGKGLLTGCKVGGHGVSLPIPVDVAASSLTLTGYGVGLGFGGGCLVETIGFAIPEETAIPDNTEAIGSLAVSGTGVAGALLVTVSGTLAADNPGTYGIG